MKLISISILLICLLAATFSQGLVIASYQLNKKYIASTLCINRNNPNAHCNGHCYLCKQLNNESQPASPLNTPGKEKLEVQLFFCEADAFQFIQVSNTAINNCLPIPFTAQLVLHKPFRPPCA